MENNEMNPDDNLLPGSGTICVWLQDTRPVIRKRVAATTICSVCNKKVILYAGDHYWYHEDGTMYCCDRMRCDDAKRHNS